MQRAFVIRPFGEKQDKNGRKIDFERVYTELIDCALKAVGLGGEPMGEIVEAGNIREDMFGLILEADIVICDMTIHNANVFYELGIRHALRKKRSVLIRGKPSADDVPFDNLTDRYVVYSLDDPKSSLPTLIQALRDTLKSESTDSPIFKLLPSLPEVDPSRIQVLPSDLSEEIERAKAARSAGWLRLLSREVETRRFQWPAMQAIGHAQWTLEDSDGAFQTYQKLIANNRNDLDANFALATLLERSYRKERKPDRLADSELAIKNVLGNPNATREQRTEALSLRGRNAKTRWRENFEGLATPAERRKAAINQRLLEAYEGYRDAYRGSLNHFWSGVAAMQMGKIARSLAEEDSWPLLFDDEHVAEAKKRELALEFDRLKGALKLALQSASEALPMGSNDRLWADITGADYLFVTDEKDEKVLLAYTQLGLSTPWHVGAVSGQLRLFVALEVRPELARTIVAALGDPPALPKPAMVIVAGHRVDKPGRVERFPESAVEAVKATLLQELSTRQAAPGGIRVLASAAPGTDIIAHELCRELGITSTICLPMPPQIFGAQCFGPDGWRARFLALLEARPEILTLYDASGLPAWLQGTGTNEWERGNQWVLNMALSAPAIRVSLIAVWDGNALGDAPGGTAHMVQIANAAGMVDVIYIDPKTGISSRDAPVPVRLKDDSVVGHGLESLAL